MLQTELGACHDGGLTTQRVMRQATLHYHMSIKRRMFTAWSQYRTSLKSKTYRGDKLPTGQVVQVDDDSDSDAEEKMDEARAAT